MTPLLEVRDLTASYGTSQVLFGLSFAAAAGECVTLIGRNGMGKTTTVKCVVAMLRARGGSVHFDGRDVARWPSHRIAQAGIGLVPEMRQIFPTLTVYENLVATARDRAKASDGAAARWSLERVYALFPRLAERAKHMGNQLSGGEQQMLAIGRALLTNPRLLILDEATEGLAPLVRAEIWKCLEQLRAAGQTILVIDKYVERLVKLADRHTIIERGRVAWQGTSAELDADHGLWHRYLGV